MIDLGPIVKENVKMLLTKKATLRDSDDSLIANYWFRELKKLGQVERLSAYGMLELIAKGKLTNPESIRRVRQKLQEENPKLRGDSYKGRQAKQSEIKKELGYA